MEYVPLTLADFRAGLFTAREPWLSPKETFRVLDNGTIYNGRVTCRRGFEPFASLCTVVSTVQAGTTGTNVSGTFAGPYPYHIAPGSIRITHPSVTPMHDRDGDGILYLEGGAAVGTINYTNGAVSWTGAGTASGNRTFTRRYAQGLPVTGLCFFNPKVGGTFIVATDTKRAYLYSGLTHTFDDLLGADTFTGGNADLFQFVPFDDMLVLNNGIDPPYKFTLPATVALLGTDFDGDLNNDIDAAKFILRHRNRLLFCGTTENGVVHPGRVRRTAQGNPEMYDTALDASDAPTNRDIVSAGLLGDNVVIQFSGSETWAYRYTGAPDLPYDWVQVATTSGGNARIATVRGERTLFTLSLDGVHESDGIQNQNIDDAIEGAVSALIEPTEIAQTMGVYLPVVDQVIWTGVEVGEVHASRFLVYDAKKQIWTTHTISMRVLAVQVEAIALTWDELEGIVDDLEGNADQLGGGVPGAMQLYGGDAVGVIHRMNSGVTDNGVPIPLTVRTQLIAPFGPTVECRLGWVDVVLDRADGKTATVSLFREYDSLPYAVQQIDLTGRGSNTKVRRRIRASQMSRYHQVEIFIPDAGGLGVDTIEPYVAPERDGVRLL